MSLELFFFLSFIAFVPCVLMLECNDIKSKSATLRLKEFLFCDYDSAVRPSEHHSNATVIDFSIIPRFVEVFSLKLQVFQNQYDDTFDLHTWVVLAWLDANIGWEPAQYDGIQDFHLQPGDIWVPDITVHNAGDGGDSELDMVGCWASSKGDVHCVPVATFSGRCNTDHKWWPFETYNCTIHLASWSQSGDEISFRLPSESVYMNEYEAGNGWIVEKAYITEHIQPFKMEAGSISNSLAVHFVLRRSTSYEYVTTIVPAIVLMVLTLSALWLEPKSMERSVVANLNFICHLLSIMDIHWQMPHNGVNVPNIIVFYNGSLALATFALILTTCLRHLQELTSKAPTWMSSGTSQILRSKLGQILLLSILDPKASAGLEMEADDNTDLVRSSKKNMVWEYVAILIGWAAFLGTFLLYVVMLGILLPKESSQS